MSVCVHTTSNIPWCPVQQVALDQREEVLDITMTLCITLSISLLIHAVLIILPSSFTSLHHEGDVLAGTAAPPHHAARHTTTTVCGDATAGTGLLYHAEGLHRCRE